MGLVRKSKVVAFGFGNLGVYKIFSSGTQPRPVSVAQAWFFHLKVSLHSCFEKSGLNQKSPEGQGQYDFAQTETSESM